MSVIVFVFHPHPCPPTSRGKADDASLSEMVKRDLSLLLKEREVSSVGDLVNYWSVTRRWYGFSGLLGRFNPRLFGFFHLLQGLLWSFTESGAGIQVGKIGDVAAIFLVIKDVDVVILHPSTIFIMSPNATFLKCLWESRLSNLLRFIITPLKLKGYPGSYKQIVTSRFRRRWLR